MHTYNVKMFYTFLFLSPSDRADLRNVLSKSNLPFFFCKSALLKSINIPVELLDKSGFFLLIFMNELSENNFKLQQYLDNKLSGYLNFIVFKNYITTSTSFDIKKVINFFLIYNFSVFKKLNLMSNFLQINKNIR